MVSSSETLIDNLIERTQKILKQVEEMEQLSLEVLSKRSSQVTWSALDCIEHLSLYNDFYNPEFSRVIKKSKHSAEELFKSGWFGNYSANSMLPKEKLNKMKTFKDKNPILSSLDKSSLVRFLKQEKDLLNLLEQARSVSLNKNKCRTTLPMVKFNLGDTFRFIIYHQERHMIQAKKCLI